MKTYCTNDTGPQQYKPEKKNENLVRIQKGATKTANNKKNRTNPSNAKFIFDLLSKSGCTITVQVQTKTVVRNKLFQEINRENDIK